MGGLMGVRVTTDNTNTQLVSGSKSNFNTILNKPKIWTHPQRETHASGIYGVIKVATGHQLKTPRFDTPKKINVKITGDQGSQIAFRYSTILLMGLQQIYL